MFCVHVKFEVWALQVYHGYTRQALYRELPQTSPQGLVEHGSFGLVPKLWCGFRALPLASSSYPKALRTHVLELLGPKTILYRAFGPF